MVKKFSRCIEDFVCESCGEEVKGNGYTNHCPFCLYSKHIDKNPGDRKNICLGLMEPIAVEEKNKKYIIVHQCMKCGEVKRNQSAENDLFESILQGIKKSRMGNRKIAKRGD